MSSKSPRSFRILQDNSIYQGKNGLRSVQPFLLGSARGFTPLVVLPLRFQVGSESEGGGFLSRAATGALSGGLNVGRSAGAGSAWGWCLPAQAALAWEIPVGGVYT